jgi:hypothetical protein
MLRVQPRISGRTNERSGNILLPRQQFTAIGIPYEIPSSTTDAETIALKALGDVSSIQDKVLFISLPG